MKEKIIDALGSSLDDVGVRVYDISFEKEDGVDTLFIKLDSDSVIDTDLCEKATLIINPIIDSLELEELKGEYVLDICSKGENDE